MKGKVNWKVALLITAILVSLTCSPVFAAVAPSVASNPAPVVVGAGTYVDAAGNETTIPINEIIITPDELTGNLSPADKVAYDQAKAELTASDSNYSKDLATFLSKNYPKITSGNIVVRDIFDISVTRDLSFGNGQKLELTLDGNYKQGDTLVVIVYNKETNKWDFIEPSDVKVNADGTMTVKFPHLSPVAVLYAENASVEKNSNMSSLLIPVLGGAAVLVIVVAAIVIIKKKKSE
jgi:hypothetical protein